MHCVELTGWTFCAREQGHVLKESKVEGMNTMHMCTLHFKTT